LITNITTKNDLREMLTSLGLHSGMEIMIHSSMRSLGYVVNGAFDVIDCIIEIIGNQGTLLMPAHSSQLTDPADWRKPAISPSDINTVRKYMQPLNRNTPIRNRGIIPQTFLNYPDVYRSRHPLNSVIAKGAQAKYFTEKHELHESEGINSPIGRLYQREGNILLLGVNLSSCTAIHLAEFIADVP